MKKKGIYIFNEPSGKVYRYVSQFLGELMQYVDEIEIVCLDNLTAAGRKTLKKYGRVIFCDDNIVQTMEQAYKWYLIYYREALKTGYCNLYFTNNNVIGPLLPFRKMFEEMNQASCDWWYLFSQEEGGRQSISYDFLVLNESIIEEICNGRVLINNQLFSNAALLDEIFLNSGFTAGEYLKLNEEEKLYQDIMLYNPIALIEKGCPIVNKNVFEQDYNLLLRNSLGCMVTDLMDYLRENVDYNLDFIMEYCIKSMHQADILKLFCMDYILPVQNVLDDRVDDILDRRKIALVIHLYQPEMLSEIMSYACNMPHHTDIYITTDTVDKQNQIKEAIKKYSFKNIEVRVILNRGRYVSSLLIGVKDIVSRYDYVCCVHDKANIHRKQHSIEEGFAFQSFSCVLKSAEYVKNILMLLENNKYIGLLCPPEQNHGTMFTNLGYKWSGNFGLTQKLLEELELHAPISETKEPIAPFESFFWFRPKALKKIFEKNWKFEVFPEEPMEDDEGILDAVERLYPYIAQDAGYYSGTIMPNCFAQREIINLRQYVRGYNSIMIENGISSSFDLMCEHLRKIIPWELSGLESMRQLSDQNANLEKERQELNDYICQLEERAKHANLKYQLKVKIIWKLLPFLSKTK